MSAEVVEVGDDNGVVVVQLVEATPITGVEIPGGPLSLEDLVDVEGTGDAVDGQVLAYAADGQWRPATPIEGGGVLPPLSYLHTQIEPATVWLIEHGLTFTPAGIEVFDHTDERHHPAVTWPSAQLVRLDFSTSIRGTARLS